MTQNERHLEDMIEAATNLLVDSGPCDNADEFEESSMCDDPECSYCNLNRALMRVESEYREARGKVPVIETDGEIAGSYSSDKRSKIPGSLAIDLHDGRKVRQVYAIKPTGEHLHIPHVVELVGAAGEVTGTVDAVVDLGNVPIELKSAAIAIMTKQVRAKLVKKEDER